jgi:uncharacterized repeat protein (TIGR03803 family)
MKQRSVSMILAVLTLVLGLQLRGAPAYAETAPALTSLGSGVVAPWGGLIQGPDRTLYGTTHDGGVFGTVYRMTPGGTPSAIYTFPNRSDGTDTDAPVTQASDGRLYGTTSYEGGPARCATIFGVNPDGTGFSAIHTWADTDGCISWGGLLQADDGYLYGTAYQGGPNHLGGIFRVAPDGSGYTVLHMFTDAREGANPRSTLIQGTDGRLYGTAWGGGPHGAGTVFAIKPDGSGFTTIYGFSGDRSAGGASPRAGVIEGGDGYLYGTTSGGGQYGGGTVYRVKPDGSGFQDLHDFGADASDGRNPHAALLLASDGRLYGTTAAGGQKSAGTVFSIGTDGGGYAVVHTFLGGASDGFVPEAGLLQADDGQLVGATTGGGTKNAGTVFTLNLGLPRPAPAIRFLNTTSGTPGTTVLIHGSYFVGVTAVTFHGAAAQFTVPSAQWIRATVPADATSGPITVTTAGGSANSVTFTVQPTITSLSASSGAFGDSVVITGTNFTGVQSVAFNGTAATYTVNSASQITVTVPTNATSGPVTVTTADGTATSAPFTVTSQPVPVTTPTPATTPTTTPPAGQPIVQIVQVSLSHTVQGQAKATTALKSGETGTFTLVYRTENAGGAAPTVKLVIMNGSKVRNTIAMQAASLPDGSTAFTATHIFVMKARPLHAQAEFSITLGTSSDSRSLAFTVTPPCKKGHCK